MSQASDKMIQAGICPEPGCGTRVLVIRETGMIRRHSPRGELPGMVWCPLGGTVHPNWKNLE